MPKIYPNPVPGPTAPSLQKAADQSRYSVKGVSTSENAAQQEASAVIVSTPKSSQTTPQWSTGVSRKPKPVKIRVIARHVAGQSGHKIAKAEKLNRSTVARIVREADQDGYVKELQAKVFGLGDLAFDSVQSALPTDAHLSFKLLQGIGAIPQQQQKCSVKVQATPPRENTLEEGQLEQASYVGSLLLEGHAQFGLELPGGCGFGEVVFAVTKGRRSKQC